MALSKTLGREKYAKQSRSLKRTASCNQDSATDSDASGEEGIEPMMTDSALGSIFSKILRTPSSSISSEVPTTNPVLSKRKAVERKIEEEQLDARARAILRREERMLRDLAHRPAPAVCNREKLLRKAATSGVVQLFNALHAHQNSKAKEEQERIRAKEEKIEKVRSGAMFQPQPTVTADIKSLSKASFLDLLKMGNAK